MSCSSGANRLGWNSRNGGWHIAERRKRPSVRPTTVEMGSCSSGGVRRTVKRRKQTCVGVLRSKRGSSSSEGVWRTAKRRKWASVRAPTVETASCSSTIYCLAPASTGYCSPTVDFLKPPPALFVHRVILLPPPGTVHPALHRLLFNQPSTGSCSSSPPRGPVHPPPTGSIGALFIERQQPLPHGVLFIQPPPVTVHPTPNNAHCSSRGSMSIGFN